MPEADLARGLEAILARCDEGSISPAIALMEMLIETEDDRVLDPVLRASSSASAPAVLALKAAHGVGCARVAAMLQSDADRPPTSASVEDGVAFCARLFDWSVRQSEEASVALYSLGSASLLEAATHEIARLFEEWGVLGPARRALDIGCGIGRLEQALAPRLRSIVGIDVSANMIDVARRRVTGLAKVTFSQSSGLDLADFEDDSFDFVFAVDSFPYLVQAGLPLVEAHFAEVARVLSPGGDFVVLQFSYRDDLARDCAEVQALAGRHGFEVITSGGTPFHLWNGAAFRLRRAG